MSDRRSQLLRLLAEVDQRIQEAEALMRDPELSDDERRFAAAQLALRRDALERIERFLGESN